MVVNHVAENVLGTIGTVFWTGQIIPQIWKSWREKSTTGLSPWLIFLWAVSGPFLGVYTIIQNINIPLIVQPQVFTFLALISWTQCLYYGVGWSKKRCTLIALGSMTLLGAFQLAMILAIRPTYPESFAARRGTQFFGIVSPVLITLGLLPQFHEIYKCKEVIGLSLTFMAVDLLGGIFSLLSLAFKPEFDVIASITYSLVIVLDGLIIVLAMILNPRMRRARQRHADSETTRPALVDVPSTAGDVSVPKDKEKGNEKALA